MDIEKRVKEILEVLFEHKISNPDEVTMDNEELWDSLKHLELIVMIEEEFDVKIPQNDVPDLNSMNLIVSKIKELRKWICLKIFFL